MALQNRWGTEVDPVPFLVVVLTAFATCYSFGPVYLLSFGLEQSVALVASTVVFLGSTTTAYHRLVWTYRPARREEVPVAARFRRLILSTLVIVGVIALLCLPFFAR